MMRKKSKMEEARRGEHQLEGGKPSDGLRPDKSRSRTMHQSHFHCGQSCNVCYLFGEVTSATPSAQAVKATAILPWPL